MKLFRAMGLLLSCIFILNGCTKMPEIQNMAYATAIGIDYEKGKWVAYAQILNFTNISHSEQMKLGESVPVWVGRGEGETIAIALTDISRTSQLEVFWGHVKAVVMTENALKKGVVEVYNTINRYREVRYNILVYGTKRELTEILIQKSLLNLSPLSTVMFTASQSSAPLSLIRPITANRIISNLNEPGEPAMIPSIDIDNMDWKEDKITRPMFSLSGAYFFQNNKMIGWMSESDLEGMRWAEKGLRRVSLQVSANGSPAAVIMFSSPKMKITSFVEKGDTRFRLNVEAKGYVIELMQDVSMEQLNKSAVVAIQKEMKTTYRKAIMLKCDPFRLRESLYRSSPSEFRKLSGTNAFFLTDDSLGEINVKVKLINTGKYKGTAK